MIAVFLKKKNPKHLRQRSELQERDERYVGWWGIFRGRGCMCVCMLDHMSFNL